MELVKAHILEIYGCRMLLRRVGREVVFNRDRTWGRSMSSLRLGRAICRESDIKPHTYRIRTEYSVTLLYDLPSRNVKVCLGLSVRIL